MTTAAETKVYVDQLKVVVDKALASAAGASDPTLRAQQVGAAKTIERAAAKWAGPYRDEVHARKRPFDAWVKYGREILKDGADLIGYSSAFLVQWSAAVDAAGNVASWVQAKIDEAFARVDELTREEAKLDGRFRSLQAQRKLFAGKPASPETQRLLFGEPATQAIEKWGQFQRLMSIVRATVALVRSGKATVEPDGKGDLRVVERAGPGLGALPVLAAGTVLATIAVCGALAISLNAFCNHLDEATRAETDRRKLDLIAQGKGADVLQLERLQANTEEQRNSGKWTTAIKWLAGVFGAGALIWGAVHLSRQWAPRRAAA